MSSSPFNLTDPKAAFCRLLVCKYEWVRDLLAHPEVAMFIWQRPYDHGKPFKCNSTALHYSANDGKDRLVVDLLRE